MNVREMAMDYLAEAPVMHLATVQADKPWTVPVYFVADDALNLYWLSWPERRHSQALAANPRAAASVAVKSDLPVIGLEAEGLAEEVSDLATIRAMMDRYTAKYDAGHDFYERAEQGRNHHRLYRLVVAHLVLFDEVHFEGPQTVVGDAAD